jgi:hypothetical protein
MCNVFACVSPAQRIHCFTFDAINMHSHALRFEEVGLPEGHVSPRLAYHNPTGTIIAHTSPRKSSLPTQRLSIRRVTERRYRPIGDFPPAISVSSFVLCPRLPLLYFVTFVWSEYENGPPGGLWETLCRFRLDTSECEVIARRGELVPPSGYDSAWIAELLSAAEDGSTLFCKAVLSAAGQGEDWVSELSVSERSLTPRAKLEAVFA